MPPIPPVYPQRPEGNIGKQVGHMCVSYSNVNHEMPHNEYMKMKPAQQKSFHTYGPPMMQAWHPCEPAPAPPAAEEKSAEPCGICRKSGDLKKFEHMDTDWTICLRCAKDAFAAEGVRLWCNGKAA
jgi:hypothetical protein